MNVFIFQCLVLHHIHVVIVCFSSKLAIQALYSYVTVANTSICTVSIISFLRFQILDTEIYDPFYLTADSVASCFPNLTFIIEWLQMSSVY